MVNLKWLLGAWAAALKIISVKIPWVFGAWSFLKNCLEQQAHALLTINSRVPNDLPPDRPAPKNHLPRGQQLNTSLTTRKSLKKSTLAYRVSSTHCRVPWEREHMVSRTVCAPWRWLKIMKRLRRVSLQAMSFSIRSGTPWANCREEKQHWKPPWVEESQLPQRWTHPNP